MADRRRRQSEGPLGNEGVRSIASTTLPVVWWHSLDGSDGVGAPADNISELWAALRLIRETVEGLAPPGSMPNDKYTTPGPMREAEAIIRGIHAIARSASPSA